ncbi:MAG: carbamoyl phosphate synthase small subunit, partial [Actinobacteria bacterium]|nr:carbamoyl phosphate synthase small subunit [Actinomycetota bacterium]
MRGQMVFDMRGRKPAVLVLADGTVFEGTSMGAKGEFLGEACFNTSMAGYQEILTDPSYAGQMVNMTYPLIGNYGVNPEDVESGRIYMGGFIVRESSRIRSNWRSTGDLDRYLKDQGVVGLEGIDTRALTKHLRSHGAMQAALSSVDLEPARLLKKIEEAPGLVGRDLVQEVTVKEPYVWSEGLMGEPEYEVMAYDFGIKRNILRILSAHGCRVTVMP